MLLIANLVLLILLVLVSFQDFKERAVSIWVFPLLVTVFSYKAWLVNGWAFFRFDLVFNLALLGIQLLVLLLYLKLVKKSVVNMLGAGDVLFFFVMAFAFSTVGFVFFFSLSLLVSLLVWLLTNRNKNRLIPLAGLQSACLIIFFIAELMFSVNPYESAYILKLLNLLG